MLATLNHPHGAAIYGFEEIDEGSLPVHAALVLAGQIAAGLEAAHETGMIHRDLKPANIRITPDDDAKVLDFGLAKGSPDGGLSDISPQLSMSPTVAAPTMAGVILGTAAYMSPEQARGRKLDRRTDIWSFGCVLYEMLTGQAAFGGDTVTDLLAAVVKDEPDWNRLPADVPGRVRQRLERCLTKNARDRLRDIGDARLEIRDTLAGTAEELRAQVAPQSFSSRTIAAFALAVVGTAALTAGAMSFIGGSAGRPAARSVQFEIAPEPGHRIITVSTAPAISPLGDAVAYSVDTPDGRQIMVRRLDEPRARLVRGTEDGRGPFFSPDGRWLGFLTERELFKIPVEGGDPVALAPGSFWRPRAVWRDAGTIIAQGRAVGDGLVAIDADDGSLRTLTTPDSANGEMFHRWPLPLADGRVLFGVVDADGAERLALYDPATGDYRVLPTQAGGPFYYRDGQLVFQRAGQLFMAPLDLATGTLTGPPSLVLAGADPEHFAIAPDGTRIVTGLTHRDENSGKQWVVELASQRRCRLGNTAPDTTEPVWSPDGRMIAHSLQRGAGYGAYWQPADGSGEPTLLTDLPFDQWPTGFSPDGELFMFYGGTDQTDIWTVPVDGSEEPSLIIGGEGNQRGGRFSPDGHYVVYSSDESGRSEIHVQPFPPLDRRWTVSSSGGTDPVWARDGSELFFRDGTRMLSVAVTLTPEFVAGTETLLFESLTWSDPYGDQSYDVFPDGQHFAMFQRDAAGEPRLRVLTGLRTAQPAPR